MVSRLSRLPAALSVGLLLPAVAFGVSESHAAAATARRPVETVRITAGASNTVYTARVDADPNSEDSPRLSVAGPVGRPLVIQAPGGLMTVAEARKYDPLAQANSLASQYLYTSPRLRTRFQGRLLIAFGWAFGSDPGSIRVISIGRGPPALIFHDDAFELDEVENIGAGREIRLIGHRSSSEEFGDCLSSYAPYSVFEVIGSEGSRYSLTLSRQYNLTHNYVWAGPTYRRDAAVDKCGAHPRLVTGAELKRRSPGE